MSEFIRLRANGVDAFPDASTENTYRPNGTSVESALVNLESNVTTLGGVAGEAKTLAEQNSVKIATAEQEISDINSSLEWINKPYTKIYSSNTIDANPAKINMNLSQYNEFILGIENRGILYASTVIKKDFIVKTYRAMIGENIIAQMQLETDGFTVWRVMPNEVYYLSVYAR